jgi:hypothetical protein
MKVRAIFTAISLLLATACSGTSQRQTDTATEQKCAGSPKNAVMVLPDPLSAWGTIVCTPYGHIISNQRGWYWSKPGGYSPVFIPSQMVRDDPKALGNSSFFTKIDLTKVNLSDPDTAKALIEVQKGYSSETPVAAYRLHVEGSLGRSLVLYFFDWGKSLNGIWCGRDGKQCASDSMFMLLSPQLGS